MHLAHRTAELAGGGEERGETWARTRRGTHPGAWAYSSSVDFQNLIVLS